MGKVYTRFQTKTAQKTSPDGAVHTYIACIREYPGERVSLTRKQPTSRDATTGFAAKWRLRNERRNSILMTRHYPDLGSASDCLFSFSTNQKHYLDLGGDGSSVWTALVSTQKTVLWPREMITSSCWIKRKCIQINRERKKNTIQENDSEDRVGRWIWKKNLENSRPPGFYLMWKREKLASIMVGTKVVCDHLRSCNLSSWLMKAFSTNDFAIVRPS